MAEAHHEDHGNTPAAWFLTVSWIVVWTGGAIAIMLGNPVILWTLITLGLSAVCAVVAGIMRWAGLGRKTPRVAPPMPAASSSSPLATDTGEETGEAEPAKATTS